ncbi:PREDICTED: odorant receptor 4-like [Dinoponera quadriceps]|uniref:Odorant receptor n=1 Tax=Dinoponera quadriceps TaxID=609295 RepID=A0A6P3X9T1_DINQU|nr:PREDICTED: odorant receptor 4-like [Dinoponera quadriceps]
MSSLQMIQCYPHTVDPVGTVGGRIPVQSSAYFDSVNMQNARNKRAALQNSCYQRDIRYVFKLNTWILGLIGIWPGIGRYASNIAIAFFNFVLIFTAVPSLLHIIYDQKDINLRLKLGGLLSFCLTAMTKYYILTIHRPKILYCIGYVKNDWWQVKFKSDRELMLRYATTGRNLTMTCAFIIYIAGVVFYLILPWCQEYKVDNQTVRPLVFPTYSGFHQSQISPLYEILYLSNCLCGYTMLSVTSGTCGLAALFATHACSQIHIIMTRLEYLLDGKNEKFRNVRQQLTAIVKDHIRIIKFTNVVEEILQEVCLVEFTSCLCVICLLEYYCILDWKANDKLSLVTYFMFFVSFCFNIYILCYIGELLMEKSSQIGLMCYMINWYELPPKIALDLILIIVKSSHPIKISAGRMVDLSLATFGNILKTTLVHLSFLRNLVM